LHDGNTDGDLDGGSEEGDNTLYYTTDANWNVTALVDAETGEVVERYMYDPYGKATVCEEDWTPREDNASAVANDVLYGGYRWDFETGLYQVRSRPYQPTLGKWMQRDPSGYGNMMSLYEYTDSSPLGHLDPLGLLTVEATFEGLKISYPPMEMVPSDPSNAGGIQVPPMTVAAEFSPECGNPEGSTISDLHIINEEKVGQSLQRLMYFNGGIRKYNTATGEPTSRTETSWHLADYKRLDIVIVTVMASVMYKYTRITDRPEPPGQARCGRIVVGVQFKVRGTGTFSRLKQERVRDVSPVYDRNGNRIGWQPGPWSEPRISGPVGDPVESPFESKVKGVYVNCANVTVVPDGKEYDKWYPAGANLTTQIGAERVPG